MSMAVTIPSLQYMINNTSMWKKYIYTGAGHIIEYHPKVDLFH